MTKPKPETPKNPAAAALARKRWSKVSAKQRSATLSAVAKARWAKKEAR